MIEGKVSVKGTINKWWGDAEILERKYYVNLDLFCPFCNIKISIPKQITGELKDGSFSMACPKCEERFEIKYQIVEKGNFIQKEEEFNPSRR